MEERKMCEICGRSVAEIDGKTQMGPWAYMCPACHEAVGRGFGLGRGQYMDGEREKKRKQEARDAGRHQDV